MSFVFRTASILNVGAAVAVKTLKYHRPTFHCAHFASSVFNVSKTVKLESFVNRRKIALNKLQSATEALRMRIVHSLSGMSTINDRDIQELIYTAEETDVDLVIAALKKSELQPNYVRFTSFMMDAVVMRMFSYLDLPDKALEAFLDEDLRNLFVGYNSVVILLELLYRHEKYQDVIRCVDTLQERQCVSNWTAKVVGCFYLSSCLKVNAPEALKKGFIYYDELLKYQKPVPEIALLALVIALKTCPENLESLMGPLERTLTSRDPEMMAAYSDIKTNVLVQALILSRRLSDIEIYLSNYEGVLARDTYDSIVILAKESGSQKRILKNISKSCKILDVTLEEWINLKHSNTFDEMDKVAQPKRGVFKGKQQFLH